MPPEKDGGRAKRKASASRGDNGRTVEKAEPSGGIPLVNVDPWGSFFEKFWEQVDEGESADRHDGGREQAKSTRAPGTKPGRRGRLPQAS